MSDVLVVGDALLDIHAAPADAIRPGGDVPAAVRLGVGGQGANLAVRLARRGLSVRLACAVGDDAAAPLVRTSLYRAGVTIVPMPARSTGAVVIVVDAVGERTMLSDRVAFRPAVAARLPELAATVDWVVVSGYLLEERGSPLERSAAGGARRMLVASPFRDADAWRAGLERFGPDLLVVNHTEAAALSGMDPDQPAVDLAAALAEGAAAETVVVTHVRGAAAVTATGPPIGIDVEPDASVVDTTGAGDAFAATLLAELHRAWPPEPEGLRAAMTRAVSVATAVARVVGAQVPVPQEDGVAR
jgi:sugar/nucleoside kinase (ribokinase family)